MTSSYIPSAKESSAANKDLVFKTLLFLFLLVLVIVTLYPFWNTIIISINQASDTLKGGVYLWPRATTLANYQSVWISADIPHAFLVSVSRTVLVTILQVFITAMLAYTLSRKEFIFRKLFTYIVIISMYVNAGLFPGYFLIRSLGLINSFWVYIVPGLMGAFNFIVIRTYIRTIPESIAESAKMDGAGDFKIFISLIIPLITPVLATVALFVAVAAWNSWFDTVLYASQRPKLFTLQYQLMALLQSSMNQSRSMADINSAAQGANAAGSMVTPVSIRAAITVIAATPILVIYPFLQRYFVVGLSVGSVTE